MNTFSSTNAKIWDQLHRFYQGKRVLVTGHTGFKGGWLSFILSALGANVVGYSLEPSTSPNIYNALRISEKTESIIGDIRELNRIVEVIRTRNVEIVFHLAAQPIVKQSYRDPVSTFETNIQGTVNVLEAIRKNTTVRSAVFITTDKVYRNNEWIWPYRETDELGGKDPYSASKACAELVVGSYVSSFFNSEMVDNTVPLIATTRAGNVIGGGDWAPNRLIPDLIRANFEKETAVSIRNPDSVRPWQHVLEPLWGYILLSKFLYEGCNQYCGAWNFSSLGENAVSVNTILEHSRKILSKLKIHYQDAADSEHEAKLLKLDSTKAEVFLDWRCLLQTEMMLAWTFDWYRAFYSGESVVNITENQILSYFELVEAARRKKL